MSTLRTRTSLIEGTISDVDFKKQSVSVRTVQGTLFNDVPVSSTYVSVKDETGLHFFPRIGDKCWIARDVNGWYVDSFGPANDPSGAYIYKRPKRFKEGTVHLYAERTGLDLLPSVVKTESVRIYATEKLGSSTENVEITTTSAPAATQNRPVQVTIEPSFDGLAITRAQIPFEACKELLSPQRSTDLAPKATSASMALVLLDHSGPGAISDVTITIFGENFDEIAGAAANGGQIDENVIEFRIPGMDSRLYSLIAVSGTEITFNVKRQLVPNTELDPPLPATPEGVFDVDILNKESGVGLIVFSVFGVRSYFTTKKKTTYWKTPTGNFLKILDIPTLTPQPEPMTSNSAVIFTIRDSIASAAHQELNPAFLSPDNTKYVGLPGTGALTTDFIALFDSNSIQRDPSDFNAARLKTVPAAQLSTVNLKATLTPIAATTVELNDMISRLRSTLTTVTIFEGTPEENRGLKVDNFVVGDRFTLEVFSEEIIPPFDASGPAVVTSVSPAAFPVPITVYLKISGENFRMGTTIALRQATFIEDEGTTNERLSPVPDILNSPKFFLGNDSTTDTNIITATGLGSGFFSGRSTVFRISDKGIGVKLEITSFDNAWYGQYDVIVQHDLPAAGNSVIVPKAINIIKPTSAVPASGTVSDTGEVSSTEDTSTGTVTQSTLPSSNNLILQKVSTIDTSNENPDSTVKDLFTYAVDEAGRLDIIAKAGVFINGKSTAAANSEATAVVGTYTQNISFASENGTGTLITKDGSVYIAAFSEDDTSEINGNIFINAENCMAVGHDAKEAFFGRRAGRVQVGTVSKEVHIGGQAKPIKKKFPNAVRTSQVAFDDPTQSQVAIGPLLVPDERTVPNFVVSNVQSVTDPNSFVPSGLGATFLSLRSRAHASGQLLEGRLNLIFVPDGLGSGTDDDPYTGTWQIPLV